MKDGFVQTKTHGRIHYLEAGAGKTIILLHSNGNSGYEYDETIEFLAKNNRVIAWDQPGHGDSEPIKRHYTVGDYADAVVEFMDALGIATASVFGSSIGGTIALDLGVRHAARIEKLFICESPVRTKEEWDERWLATERGYTVPVQTEAQVKPRLRQLKDGVLERWNMDRLKAGTWAMMDVMWSLREYDVHGMMSKVTTSTMIVYGDKTPHPRGLATFMGKVAGASGTEMKDCGHFPMLDDAEALADMMNGFIHGA